MSRGKKIEVRLTPEEKIELVAVAEGAGVSASEYIRRRIFPDDNLERARAATEQVRSAGKPFGADRFKK